MKKTFLAVVMASAGYAASAQVDSMRNNMKDSTNLSTNAAGINGSTLNSMGEYNAFTDYNSNLPEYVKGYFTRDYPAATDVRWRQSEDWYRGYYMENGQPVNVFYDNRGNSFRLALPVRQSLVPDEVVSRAVSMYGPALYDITAIKGSEGQDVYHVRVIENGTASSQYMGLDGARVMDVYRVETAEPMMSSDMNAASSSAVEAGSSAAGTTSLEASSSDLQTTNSQSSMQTGKMKIKTKSSDGKQTKTKVKDGKVIHKEE